MRGRASATPLCARSRRPSTTRRARCAPRGAHALRRRVRRRSRHHDGARRGAPGRAGGAPVRRGGAQRGGAGGALRVRGQLDRRRRSPLRCSCSRASTASRAPRSTRGRRSRSCARHAALSAAALEARRSAARAAAEAGLKTREATLTINVGFALTTVGARDEARVQIEAGIALAQAVGSPGTVRHGQMNLMCWTATFGPDRELDRPARRAAARGRRRRGRQLGAARSRHARRALLSRPRALAGSAANPEGARALLRTAANGYRATKMLDVVPVALGFWAEAERRAGSPERASELAAEAVALLARARPACSTRPRSSSPCTTPASISGVLRRPRTPSRRGCPGSCCE